MVIEVSKNKQIGILTINRPDSLNAMNREVLIEFINGLKKIQSEKDTRVIIITGSGEKAFIAGADIKVMQKMKQEEAFEFANLGHELANLIEKSKKPIIKIELN